MPSVEELIAVKEQVEGRFLGQPGVTAVDVGYKEVGGRPTGEIAIRVHVESKRDDVPDDQRVPAQIAGAVTDVLERRYEPQARIEPTDAEAQPDTGHYAVLTGGISMGPSRKVSAGTLGAIVVDRLTGKRVALTNWHVTSAGDQYLVGDRMVQPGRFDGGTVPGDEFGSLVRARLSSAVDGAVVSVDPGRLSDARIVDIGLIRGTRTATLGMAVRKRGRTTGLTHGTVDGIAGTVSVDYKDGKPKKVFTGQLSVTADVTSNAIFSAPGDSGSVIVDSAGFVVGLLFAGTDTSTSANPIASVLTELDISFTPLVKGKEIEVIDKPLVRDVVIRKDLIPDTHPYVPRWPYDPGYPDQVVPVAGRTGLDLRLAALEGAVGQLAGFIGAELRPDLAGTTVPAEADLDGAEVAELRAALEQQVADAVAAKAEFDSRRP